MSALRAFTRPISRRRGLPSYLEPQWTGPLRWVLVLACLNQGRVEAALAEAQRALDGGTFSRAERARFHGQGSREYCGHYLLPDLAVLAGLLGEREEVRRAVAQLARYAADREGPALHRSAAFAAAILDGEAGALLAVADGYAAAGRPLREAQAREHAAEALAVAGPNNEARLQLDAAQDRYTGLNGRPADPPSPGGSRRDPDGPARGQWPRPGWPRGAAPTPGTRRHRSCRIRGVRPG